MAPTSPYKLMYNLFAGQSNLIKSSILVIGAGGLGSPALLYLAACGVGEISVFLFLVDFNL